jgi:hypothetical protein
MAEEGTLGIARAQDISGDELSKEDLQRRMDEARESISQTVTEIKDSVVHQYESVKETISETLDWREQFKKRPVAWTAGALGAGFLAGYGLTAIVKGDDNGHDRYAERYDYQPSARRAYAAQAVVGSAASQAETQDEDEGPGIIQRIQETEAFDRLRTEASTVGNRLVSEVSKTAQEILLPAAVGLIRGWLEGLVSSKGSSAPRQGQGSQVGGGVAQQSNRSSYQPVAERSQ